MLRLFSIAAALCTLAAWSPVASAAGAPYCQPGQSPRFAFGFAALKDAGVPMGNSLECEHANLANGDTLQQTSTGLSFYRKSTNTPTFTDGFNHWALTKDGLASWVGTSIDPPGVSVAPPAPAQTLRPALNGAAPDACDWETNDSITAYFCIYPNNYSADWTDASPGGDWVLLATFPPTGGVNLTEAGRYAFGYTTPSDPAYRGARPEYCGDSSNNDGPYRLCQYAGGVAAVWTAKDGAWVLDAYEVPPAETFTFTTTGRTAALNSHPPAIPRITAPPATTIPPASGTTIESRIDGDFTGWSGDTLFKLQNGQIWQQSSYAYTYSYAYSPRVLIYPSNGGWRMQVDGVSDSIAVTRLR